MFTNTAVRLVVVYISLRNDFWHLLQAHTYRERLRGQDHGGLLEEECDNHTKGRNKNTERKMEARKKTERKCKKENTGYNKE